MKESITIGENTLTIRRIKAKEIKTLLILGKDKWRVLAELEKSDDLINSLLEFFSNHFDWAVSFVAQMTDKEAAELEEWDIADLVALVMKLLAFNGLTKEKISDFFTNVGSVVGQILTPTAPPAAEEAPLTEDIPQLGETVPQVAKAAQTEEIPLATI